jgi:starch phosphorylase
LLLPDITGSAFAAGAKEAVQLNEWHDSLVKDWSKLRFGKREIHREGDEHIVDVTVYFDEIDINSVQVQLYAEPQYDAEPEIYVMDMVEQTGETPKGYLYHTRIPANRPPSDYTPRIVPCFKGAILPLEASNILWFE